MSNEESHRSIKRQGLGLGIAGTPAAEEWVDMFKQQLRLALDLSDATLAGVERVCAAQLEAAREAHAQGRGGAEAIAEVKDMRGLLAVQSALASTQWQRVGRFLSGMAEIAQQTNLDCARILASHCTRLGGNWKPASAVGAAQLTSGDLFPVWKSVFDAAQVSSDTMMRALTGQAPWLQNSKREAPLKAKAA